MKKFIHKKRFGQNFLRDKNIINKIIRMAEIKENELIWEIGAGKGALTEELIKTKAKITAFEIDYTLHEFLEKKFNNKISLVKKDVLKVNWDEIIKDTFSNFKDYYENKIKIVANLPYQITTPFLFKVVKFSKYFSSLIIMIQKEVADRIVADADTKNYGILSLKIQYYFEPKILFKVPPHLFIPQPKVDSAVIKLIPRKNKPNIKQEELFWNLVKICFINRRKMLRKNLLNILSKEEIEDLNKSVEIDLTSRGEKLNEEDFINLHLAILDIIAKR